MKMTTKHIFWIIIIIVAAITLNAIIFWKAIGLWGEWVFNSAKFVECNPKKVTAPLQRTFDIRIPAQAKEIKAAVYSSWDNWKTLILEFTVEPNVADEFLKSVHFRNSSVYTSTLDQRDRYPARSSVPRWFATLIREGKILELSSGQHSASFYVDTSDKKNYIIYVLWSFHGAIP
jgi:hypothetical protein